MFLTFFGVCRDSACIIAYFQSFPSPHVHSWVPTRVFKLTAHFQLVFNIQLLSTIFSCFLKYISICFQLFSIDFIHFWSSLFVFDCFYPNSSVTAYFHLFFHINFNYFHSFSTILDKNCFTPSSYSQTGSGRVGPRANRAWPCPRTVYNRTVKQRFSHQ